MRDRPLCFLVCCFLLGLMKGMGFLLVPFLYLFSSWKRNRDKTDSRKANMRKVICFFCLQLIFFGIGFARMSFYEEKRDKSIAFVEEHATDGEMFLQGNLYKKEVKNEQSLLYLNTCFISVKNSKESIPCNGVMVSSKSDIDSYSIGKTLIFVGKLNQMEEARNEGNFDAKSYYAANGIDFKMKEPKLLKEIGRPNTFMEGTYRLKEQISHVYERRLSEEEAGVLSTMVLGNKGSLQQETKDLYRAIGISHVLSISGLHISLIGVSLYHFLRRVGAGYKGSFLLSAIVILMYGSFTGGSVSVKRAIGTLLLIMLADSLGRTSDLLTSLAVTAFLILIKAPYYIADGGFQLSFLAVIGAGLVGRILIQYVGNYHGVKKGLGMLLVNIGVYIAILPLLANHYYEFPTYGILSNFILVPFAGVILLAGMLGGFFGVYQGAGFQGISNAALNIAHVLLCFYKWLGQEIHHLPQSILILGSMHTKTLLAYICVVMCGLYWFYHHSSEKNKETWQKYVRIFTWFFMLFLLCLWPHKTGMEIDMLDLGQGEGIYIQTEDGLHFFIDGGSTSVKEVGKMRILPFLKYKGAKSIDYWFISHADEDHISGLLEILKEDYPVKNIVISKHAPRGKWQEEIERLAGQMGIPIRYMEVGDSLYYKNGNLSCLFPTKEYYEQAKAEDKLEDLNDFCLTLLFTYQGNKGANKEVYRGIFAGDLTKKGEEYLLKMDDDLSNCELYKVNHHGSKTSSSEAFLERINSRYALISAGLHNVYHHPDSAVVTKLREAGNEIYNTAEFGQIRIRFIPDIKIETHLVP